MPLRLVSTFRRRQNTRQARRPKGAPLHQRSQFEDGQRRRQVRVEVSTGNRGGVPRHHSPMASSAPGRTCGSRISDSARRRTSSLCIVTTAATLTSWSTTGPPRMSAARSGTPRRHAARSSSPRIVACINWPSRFSDTDLNRRAPLLRSLAVWRDVVEAQVTVRLIIAVEHFGGKVEPVRPHDGA